jgi:hypothetical protein
MIFPVFAKDSGEAAVRFMRLFVNAERITILIVSEADIATGTTWLNSFGITECADIAASKITTTGTAASLNARF